MKLIRFGTTGNEKPGIQKGEVRYDVSGFGEDYNQDFFENDGLSRLAVWLKDKDALPEIGPDIRLGSPVKKPGKIVCVGLNYRKHAEESGMEVPKEPVLFFKATSSISGPYDDIVIPKNSTKTDWRWNWQW